MGGQRKKTLQLKLKCLKYFYLAEEFRICRAVLLVTFLGFLICPIDTITFTVTNISRINTFRFVATKLSRMTGDVLASCLDILVTSIPTIVFTIASVNIYLLKKESSTRETKAYVYLSSMHLAFLAH